MLVISFINSIIMTLMYLILVMSLLVEKTFYLIINSTILAVHYCQSFYL